MNEKIDSVTSYSIGGCAIALSLADISTVAQQLAMIFGCIVVIIRVVHDAIGLWHKLKGHEEKNNTPKD